MLVAKHVPQSADIHTWYTTLNFLMEIAGTNSPDFREMLKAQKAVLRGVANQLGADRGLETA